MRGDIDDARALHAEADDIIEDLGRPLVSAANASFTRAILELLAGAPERAEHAARAGLEAFEAMRNRNQGSTAAALLALALVEQGRDDEALEFADLAAAWAAPDDTASQVGQLAVRARVLAGRGELAARRGGGEERCCAVEQRPTSSRYAAMRSSTSRSSSSEPAAPSRRPTRYAMPLRSTNARATPSPPAARA